MGKLMKLIEIFSFANVTSPVMERALELAALKVPRSWAARRREQVRTRASVMQEELAVLHSSSMTFVAALIKCDET